MFIYKIICEKSELVCTDRARFLHFLCARSTNEQTILVFSQKVTEDYDTNENAKLRQREKSIRSKYMCLLLLRAKLREMLLYPMSSRLK